MAVKSLLPRDVYHLQLPVPRLALPGETMRWAHRVRRETGVNSGKREIDLLSDDGREATSDGLKWIDIHMTYTTSSVGPITRRRRPDNLGKPCRLMCAAAGDALEAIPDPRQYACRGVDDLKRLLCLARSQGKAGALVG